MLNGLGQKDQCLAQLRKSIPDLLSSKYPAFWTIIGTKRLLENPTFAGNYAKYLKLFPTKIAESFATPQMQGMDQRFVLEMAWDVVETDPALTVDRTRTNFRQSVIDAVSKIEGADPWLVKMYEARFYVDLAWEKRTGNVAAQVNPQQGDAFNENLRKAVDCLKEAQRLHPEFPESAALMVQIAMADQEIAGGTPRHWADAAITCQLDYAPACSALLWALRPRWGGSVEEMLSYGLECAATKRFDTIVPWFCMDAIRDVVDEVGVEKTPLARDDVFQQVAQMLKGYANAQDVPLQRDWYLTYLLGLMWDQGRYREAAEVLGSAPIKIDPSGLTTAGSMPAEVAAGLEAMRGDAGSDVRSAESSFRGGQLEKAQDSFEAILPGLKADDPARPFVESRIAELGWLTKFLAGESVEIQPGKSLAGWYPGAGKWKVDDDGALVGELSPEGLRCICGANFGTRYELTAAVEVVSGEAKRDPKVGAGILFGWINPGTRYCVTVCPRGPVEFDNQQTGDQPMINGQKSERKNTIVITVWDNCCAAEVNGQHSFDNMPLWYYCATPDARIGLGSRIGGSAHTARFSDLKIRMLTDRPKIVSRVSKPVKPT
jgi:NAD-dependent dihydropyrimidine dehydrogenase PreA subunit